MNKYIQKLIQEQFNIGNMDLSNNKLKRNMNIFNKNITNPYYKKVLDGTVTEDEIKELNSLPGITKPNDKNELRKIIEFYSENYPEYSLNWLDVSGITDMSLLFSGERYCRNKYNGDISKWNTSNVTNMHGMFNWSANFNLDISGWDVSSVTDMSYMFYQAYEFNQPIGEWDVSSVNDMSYMFYKAYEFNKPIGDWDVSGVTNMCGMFGNAEYFNQPIGGWDVSSVTNMYSMFNYAKEFNQSIGNWDVSKVTNMIYMFYEAKSFNQDISGWNINDKTRIDLMFVNCLINFYYKPIKCRFN